MAKKTDPFAAYVSHPLYGRRPRVSNEPIHIDRHEQFCMVSRCGAGKIFKNTAIKADMELQKGSHYLVKYFFDEDKTCIHCKRPFIFFAAEQKYWFDQLHFNIATRGQVCGECRAFAGEQKLLKLRYDQLLDRSQLTNEQTLEMAQVCLSLVESGVFHPRSVQTVQKFLNVLRVNKTSSLKVNITDFRKRIGAFQTLSIALEQNVRAGILRAFPMSLPRTAVIQFKVARELEAIARKKYLESYISST